MEDKIIEVFKKYSKSVDTEYNVYNCLIEEDWPNIAQEAVKLFRQSAVISRFNSDTFIDNVCLSYRHDFGFLAEQDRQRLRFECKEWMRAISNNWEYFKNGL